VKIKTIELIEIKLPLVHFFETSFGRTYERRIILTRVEDDASNEGWGEVTCGETPSYCEEWTDSAWVTIEKILAPMVIGREIKTASLAWDLMKKVRGNRMAKAAVETACWDLEAKKLNLPLWKHLGGINKEIACGVSIAAFAIRFPRTRFIKSQTCEAVSTSFPMTIGARIFSIVTHAASVHSSQYEGVSPHVTSPQPSLPAPSSTHVKIIRRS